MKIKSLDLCKIYSFGPPQKLDNFSKYNLFIGPNGSGKTNVLKVISGFPYLFKRVGEYEINIPSFDMNMRMLPSKHTTLYRPELPNFSKGIINHDMHLSKLEAHMQLTYEYSSDAERKIVCEESADKRMVEFRSGDVSTYAQGVALINLPKTNDEFLLDLTLLSDTAGHGIDVRVINSWLFYIFGRKYDFVLGTLIGPFMPGRDYERLPSGVLQMAKLLVRMLLAYKKSVLLIDEPELHVEPRFQRAFLEILVLYCSYFSTDLNPQEKSIVEKFESKIKGKAFDPRDILKINNLVKKQVFVASHSSVLINKFLHLKEAASIYRFNLKDKEFECTTPFMSGYESKEGTFSFVDKIDDHPGLILESLGCKGSDLLQCNGVIWVEGPSDVIYIRKWLEMYAREKNLPSLNQGLDYEFQMYGGTILNRISWIEDGADEAEELGKLVQMLSFSRNAYVVIDSDAEKDENGEIRYKSKFENGKLFIKNQFSELHSRGYKVGLWYDQENTTFKTIEDFLDADSEALLKKGKKVQSAFDITEGWGASKQLNEFDSELVNEIKKMYDCISSW